VSAGLTLTKKINHLSFVNPAEDWAFRLFGTSVAVTGVGLPFWQGQRELRR
jgi:hypothetical protein